MSEFRQRTVTGLFFVLALIFAILGNIWTLSGLFFLFTLIGLNEFFEVLSKKERNNPLPVWGMLFGVVLYWLIVLSAMNIISFDSFIWLIPVLVLGGIWSLFSKGNLPSSDLGLALLGAIVVAGPFALLSSVGMLNGFYQFEIILGFFIMLWSNDTGAYLVGRKIGKHKLFERISPKKSWEGFFGGVVVCFIAAAIISRFYETLNLQEWLVIAAIVSVFSNLGDLFESMFKRNYQVKDSGTILPGHGGVLDRFDGLIFAVPMIYFYLVVK